MKKYLYRTLEKMIKIYLNFVVRRKIEFEILIDDEDLKFDAPWKQSIIEKIMEADSAILFISNDALKPDLQ